MTSPTNQERTARAEAALHAYTQAAGPDAADEALIDLLTDLMHWADGSGVNFNSAIEHAQFHFIAEVES